MNKHHFRMTFVVKKNEAFDPGSVGLLGSVTHPAQADRRANLVK